MWQGRMVPGDTGTFANTPATKSTDEVLNALLRVKNKNENNFGRTSMTEIKPRKNTLKQLIWRN